MRDEEFWMRAALEQAKKAFVNDEVPIGAVVVLNNRVIGRGYNMMQATGDPFAHAEIIALKEASSNAGRFSLSQCCLYVTVEPCLMCVGALLIARVAKLAFGADEPRSGACGSRFGIPFESGVEHRMAVSRGVGKKECRAIMEVFFKKKKRGN